MNKNIENYKKAIDQIKVDENLKEKVLENTKDKKVSKKPIYYLRYAVSLAAVTFVTIVGLNFYNIPKEKNLKINKNIEIDGEEILAESNIKRFKNIEELRDILEELEENSFNSFNFYDGIKQSTKSATTESEGIMLEDTTTNSDGMTNSSSNSLNYSKTNNQVENVDEADIVKTDGKYIYYCKNSKIYILDNDLNQKAVIQSKDDNFSPSQIFVNGDSLIILGNKYSAMTRNIIFEDEKQEIIDENNAKREDISVDYRPKTVVEVYNLNDIENPELEREINVDGNFVQTRMIGNNIYFVSSYYMTLYDDIKNLKDIDILPTFKDSYNSEKDQIIEASSIAYFDNDNNEDYSYSIVAGFCLDTDDNVNIETFLGSTSDIYVSEKNLYIISENYDDRYWSIKDSTIYKFKLNNGKILANGSVNVEGYINNQFSIDEYNGNLRIATTVNKNNFEINESLINLIGAPVEKYENKLTIFNENLEKIGEIENLIEDEEIYAVRFIGNIGYIVTFEEIDPLWVIDLSDPKNPVVKGELEIPGYSSYLQPWDENHIIGFGYNVKDNGYGGVTNDTMKVSMFDVSDLENPKEIFNISFDKKYVYSNIMYEHKALFINKDENLIGFPVNWYDRQNSTGLILYKVDLENNKFDEIKDLISKGYGFVQRAIYIGNNIYCLFDDRIIKYDMSTFEELKSIKLDRNYDGYLDY